MRLKTKETLKNSGIIVLVFAILALSFKFGTMLGAMSAIIICEFLYNFILVPMVVKNFYKLHGVDEPSLIARFIPFYNQTMVMGSGIAIASIIMIVVYVVLTLIITLLGGKIASLFNVATAVSMLENLPLLFLLMTMLVIIFIGTSFGHSVSVINKKYEDEYLDSNVANNIIKFIITKGSTFLMAIPVIRAFPCYIICTRSKDLVKSKVKF